jgi:subtilase family serine protease
MVKSYFESYGLKVTVSPDGLSVSMYGPTTDVAAAFHTSISMFKEEYNSSGLWNPEFGSGSAKAGSISYVPYYANTQPIYLPQSLSNVVSGVVGLDEARATPDLALPAGLAPGTMSIGTPSPAIGNACSAYSFGTCLTNAEAFNESYGNFTWIGTSSTDPFCHDYNICNYGDYQLLMPQSLPAMVGAHSLWDGSAAIGGLPDKGQNITVAVIEAGCLDPQTLQNFSAQLWGNPNQVTGRFTQFALSGVGPSGTWGEQRDLSDCLVNATDNGWEGETSLDVEYLAAMAPSAHIDLIGVPYSTFDEFDQAYQFIISNLSTGAPCEVPFGTVATIVGIANDTNACSVTIDSNSYGTGEAYVSFSGSPIYLTVENQLLDTMSLEGITNFFASGDYSGGGEWGMEQADMPSIATGAISVGGGQLTAMAPNGYAFQNTSKFVPMCEDWISGACGENLTLNVTPAIGIDSFTFWAYNPYAAYGSIYSFYDGVEGGGHGASETLATPWWQNANDTYSAGVKVDPQISNAAAFNMTFWAPPGGYGMSYDEGWTPLYGGTSFACPITAGEWALIEEQAKTAGKVSKFGDISALLFALHDAGEAGVPYAATSPYYPMGIGGEEFDNANFDSFNWYYYNLSIVQSPGTNLPPWGFSVDNPAGTSWNFLGGIGAILVPQMVSDVLGSSSTVPSVTNSHMSVVEIVGANKVPVTVLNAGTSYTFAVVNSTTGALIPNVDVWAYSGGANEGTYAGGTTTFISSLAGTFTYDPTYAANGLNANYTEYAYFMATVTPVAPGNQWAFNAFAVIPNVATGTLTLEVATPVGTVSSGSAEITSFTEFDESGWYTLGSTAEVLLNGLPAPGAVVTQTSVNWNMSLAVQSSIPPSAWAPGTLVSNWISDTGGEVTYFANGMTAEFDGVIPAQVFQLQATYDGLTSAPVTVYVEAQGGLFEPNLVVNPSVTAVSGNVSFSNMKYLTWLNISAGGGPGQFENFSCANDVSFCNNQITPAGLESSLMSGTVPVSITIPSTDSPLNVTSISLMAAGNNTVFSGNTYSYVLTQPLWFYPVEFSGRFPAPAVTLTSLPAGGVVSASVSLSFSSTWAVLSTKLKGAVGTLSETWPGGGSVLASGMNLVNNGTQRYSWDTTLAPAGHVWITFSVRTPSGVFANASNAFYVAKPSVTVSPASPYAGQNTTFTAWSEGGSGLTHFWSFGDGATSSDAQPVYAYPSAGGYTVTAIVNDSSGISVVESTSVTVLADGIPVVTASLNPAYIGQSVGFSVSVPAGGPQPPLKYSWSFGDGSFSALTAPLHAFSSAGVYTVTVWENGTGTGVTATLVMTVNAVSAPVITASANPVYPGWMTYFSVSVPAGGPQAPLNYSWLFGDGSSSQIAAPGHAYAQAGSYTVNVWENGTGIGVNATLKMVVTAIAAPAVTSSRSAVDTGQSVFFSLSQPTGAPASPVYRWHFGDGGISSMAAPQYVYARAGAYTVTVWENNSNGIGIMGKTTITVSPALSVAVGFSPSSPVVGSGFTITATVTGGTGTDEYAYYIPADLGCPAAPAGAQVGCNATAAGQYSVAVVVTDSAGISVVQVATVTVTGAASPTPQSNSTPNWELPLAIALAVVAVLLAVLYVMERNKRKKATASAQVNPIAPVGQPPYR